MNMVFVPKRETFLYFYLALSQSLSKLKFLNQRFSLEDVYRNRHRFDAPNILKLTKLQQSIWKKYKDVTTDQILKWLSSYGQDFVTILDDNYPKNLKNIKNPPPVLFYRGKFPVAEDDFSIAVVGTRKFTFYGKQVTEKLVSGLVQSKFVIVSGLASGIDSEAHRITIRNNGRTIAVLGGGIDEESIFPPQNRNLANEIIKNGGALVSEHPPGSESLPHNFPLRDRIMAGLAKGVLVVESPKRSGSLITASIAINEGRDVFAVPGEIFKPNSEGTNSLIKNGAKITSSVDDILEEFGLSSDAAKIFTEAKKHLPKNKLESQIMDVLKYSEAHIDDISRELGLPTSTISQALSLMEIEGSVKHLGGMVYKLI